VLSKIKSILIAVAVAFAWTAPLFAADTHPFAPLVSFSDISGQKISLNQFRGSVVLLNFWTSSCSACLAEIPALSALQTQYAADGLRVIGLASDNQPEAVRKVLEQRHVNYTVALGAAEIQERFGVDEFPVTLLIGRDGRVYSRHSGAIERESLQSEIRQLLGADTQAEAKQFRASENADPVQLPTDAELKSEIPGIDVSQLSEAQLTELRQRLTSLPCPCGCNRSILGCLSSHTSCKQSKALARAAAERLRSPMI